jgi:hypothetical protein
MSTLFLVSASQVLAAVTGEDFANGVDARDKELVLDGAALARLVVLVDSKDGHVCAKVQVGVNSSARSVKMGAGRERGSFNELQVPQSPGGPVRRAGESWGRVKRPQMTGQIGRRGRDESLTALQEPSGIKQVAELAHIRPAGARLQGRTRQRR